MKTYKEVLYFDNAATSWPKPDNFIDSIKEFINNSGGNPGRSAHRMSIAAVRIVEGCRDKIAELFNISDTSRIVFSKNATESLNLAINGFLSEKDSVLISGMEHNSVVRPLRDLELKGLKLRICPCNSKGILYLEEMEKILKRNKAKLAIICHASNVTGTIQDLKKISDLCKNYNTRVLVDASQSAGLVDIDVKNLGIDMLAFTGHKSLLGPQGTGGLYISEDIEISPLIRGGTGSKSDSEYQPDFLPDKFESGTINAMGICALSSSLDYIMHNKDIIYKNEKDLTEFFINGIADNKYIELYGPMDIENRTSVISFNIKNLECSEAARILDFEYGVLARPGLHCAPLAHKTIGTFPTGALRFSFGSFNTLEQIKYAVSVIEDIIKKYVLNYG